MWKPTNQPQTPAQPPAPERPTMSTPSAPMASAEPAAPRPVTTTTADQATIGKSLVIKGEVTGSESLYIDGRVEGSINLAGNRVTIGRNGVVAANINAREIVVLGKVRGNLTASDRVDIRSDGSLTGDVSPPASPSKTAPSSKAASTSAKAASPTRPSPTAKTNQSPPRASRSRRPGVSSQSSCPLFSDGRPQGCPFCFELFSDHEDPRRACRLSRITGDVFVASSA